MEGEMWTLLQMQQKLGHTRIDMLKMDIEGFELNIFDSWPELAYEQLSEQFLLPHQILVEVSSYCLLLLFCFVIFFVFVSFMHVFAFPCLFQSVILIPTIFILPLFLFVAK